MPFDISVDKLADIARVAGEVEREQVGVRQAQRQHSPQLRHQRVIAIAGIAEVVHPVEVVVHRVVDAVVAVEAELDDGQPTKFEKDGVVGAAADAGVGRLASVTAGSFLVFSFCSASSCDSFHASYRDFPDGSFK